MTNTLEDKDWNVLLRRIKEGKCTPFIGAGACFGKIPLGGEIANDWAKNNDYPLEDCGDLARVAQYLAITEDPMSPKEKMRDIIAESIKAVVPQYFETPDEPHGVLADLPLPIYITTNYDNFMVQALKYRKKNPFPALCCWNEYLTKKYSSVKSGQTNMFMQPISTEISKNPGTELIPTMETPVVFHLHGYYETPESMVLTEDDYLEFLVKISREQQLLPSRIQQAFAETSILFLGYRIADWNFRVLFRILTDYLGKNLSRAHISVQLAPVSPDFHETEFKPPLSIEKLCKAIDTSNYPLSLKTQRNTIEWLNELLEVSGFYTIFTEKQPDSRLSQDIRALANKTQEYRDKEFSSLDYNKKNDVKRLNRLILREVYPEETPKSSEDKAQEYLNRYFGDQKIRVYWGNCREFAAELKRRWEAFPK